MIDIHLHLDGSLAPEDVMQLAKIAGVRLPSDDVAMIQKLLTVEPNCRDLGEYLEKFDLPLMVLQQEETLRLSVYGLIRRLAKQGLCYAEIRFAPQLHLAKGLTQKEVVKAAAAGLEDAVKDFGMPAQLILCCMRSDDNADLNRETVEAAAEFLGKGICALDLAGNEAAYPTESFRDLFDYATEQKIPAVIHAGEAAGAESVRQALELGAVRISHGTRSREDAGLLELLRDRKIPLELCYTSNLQTRAVSSKEDYPLCQYHRMGIPVTVNTDNMTVSGTDLRQEYRLLQADFGLSSETLEELALNALNAAFLTEETRVPLSRKIKANFKTWLAGNQA